jgi:hypothetical protein
MTNEQFTYDSPDHSVSVDDDLSHAGFIAGQKASINYDTEDSSAKD